MFLWSNYFQDPFNPRRYHGLWINPWSNHIFWLTCIMDSGWLWLWFCRVNSRKRSHSGQSAVAVGFTWTPARVTETIYVPWVWNHFLRWQKPTYSYPGSYRFQSLPMRYFLFQVVPVFIPNIPQHVPAQPFRSILLVLLCICMGGTPVLENPGSSLIWLHSRFQWLLSILEAAKVREP